MREILFRGKRIGGKWVEGLISKPHVRGENGKVIIYYFSILDEGLFTSECSVRAETVCQYTGLTDKNGRKIFEGDIVRDIFNSSVVGIVKYGEYQNTFNDDEYGGHAGFYIEWKEKKDLLRKDLAYWVKNSEFIGNIFDNPELISDSE